MNENLNLVEILKDCPKGTKLYSTVHGEVEFNGINESDKFPVRYINSEWGREFFVTAQGLMLPRLNGECTLFPSREQRDWSKFKPKKPKFDPKTLKPFDKILARNYKETRWRCTFYSHKRGDDDSRYEYATSDSAYIYCIPYNDDTKHLVGTSDEAPEYYRYWED